MICGRTTFIPGFRVLSLHRNASGVFATRLPAVTNRLLGKAQCPPAMVWVRASTTQADRDRIIRAGCGQRVHAIEYVRSAVMPPGGSGPRGRRVVSYPAATLPVRRRWWWN